MIFLRPRSCEARELEHCGLRKCKLIVVDLRNNFSSFLLVRWRLTNLLILSCTFLLSLQIMAFVMCKNEIPYMEHCKALEFK